MRLPALFACLAALAAASAPSIGAEDGKVLSGAAAYGDWRADAPGLRRKLTPADLPAVLATPPAGNPSEVAARPPGALPKVPAGFSVSLFAHGLTEPRILHAAPNGDVFVAESAAGRIRALRAPDGAATAATAEVFAAGLDRPFGIAFYPPGPNPTAVYVATRTQILRFPYRSGDLAASGPAEVVVPALPGGGGHWTRDVVFSADGKTMYVSVGSGSNDAEDMPRLSDAARAAFAATHAPGAAWGPEERRADVLAFDPDGGRSRVFATGLRNCVGLALQPPAGPLWCAVNERDMLGDDLPPDYATSVAEGGFYGWPWFYIGANEDPNHRGARPDLAAQVATPDVLIQPHSAPLGIAFYEGSAFPPDYRGDAFVALHGSWNRAKRTGYKVVRLIFHEGRPTGEYEDFLVGFVADAASVWGRPVGVAVAHDGALLVSDDAGGAIWRVARSAP